MTDAFRLASPDGRPVDPEVPGSVHDLDASVAALLAQHDASRTDGPPPWPPTWAMYGRMWEERDKATAEVRRLRARMLAQDAVLDELRAEVRRLRGLMRACLALNNARTGSDLIAAETAWRAALAPFLEADRG